MSIKLECYIYSRYDYLEKATLYLNGREIKIIEKYNEDGTTINTDGEVLFGNYDKIELKELDINRYEIKEDLFLCIFNTIPSNDFKRIVLNNSNYNTVNTYCKNLNKDIYKVKKSFEKEIVYSFINLSKEEYFNTLIINFISQTNHNILLNWRKRLHLEIEIGMSNNIGTFCLNHFHYKSTKYGLVVTGPMYSIRYEYEYKRFMLELDNIIGLLNLKYKFESKEHILYTAFFAISYYAKKVFSNMWEEEFGQYFVQLNGLDIESIIDIYCNIEFIHTEEICNIGKFTYYLMDKGKFGTSRDFLDSNNILIEGITNNLNHKKLMNFEQKIMNTNNDKIKHTIFDVDLMNGYEFEEFVGLLFSKMGFSVEVTKGSGDQGIDVLVENNGNKIGIQTKRYSNKVTNTAIQEVVAGLKYYDCYKGIVITNNYFTNSAIKLADANDIILWDRNMLKEKIDELL